MASLLDFENSLIPLEREMEGLRQRTNGQPNNGEREDRLRQEMDTRLREVYRHLTPWQKVQVARHRERPYTLDYLQRAFTDFVELRGDRNYADDRSIVAGPGVLNGRSVMVIGHQKGRDTKENLDRHFGMPHPEGYRKAERLMHQAERLGMPLVTFVDTPGAHAGLTDEERGQSEAIASSIATMLSLKVPTVAVVIGEGGSGGALAIAAADALLMLEHSVFMVASPEAAAAILWHDSARASDAAHSMRITAQELKEFGLVDEIVPEPVGGAHRDHLGMARTLGDAVARTLDALGALPVGELLEKRYHKYRDIRFFVA